MKFTASLVALVLLCSEAHALEWLSVQVPAQYEGNMAIPDAIRHDCTGLDRTVGIEVAYRLEKSGFARIDHVERINPKAKGKQLSLTITQAAATKGQWTDPKSLTVKAELLQDGQSFEWTTISHTSRSQLDVCEVMEKNAADIAQDVHKWLMTTLKSKTLPTDLNSIDSAKAVRQLQGRDVWITGNVFYDLDSPSRQLITQCSVDESLIGRVRNEFSKSLAVKLLKQASEATAGEDVLQFSIVEIKGSIDNAPEKRSMTVQVDLLRDGKVIDTYTGIHRTEHAGLFGQIVRNTCDALNDIGNTMATDTYQWYLNRGASVQPATTQPAIAKPSG